MYIWQIDRNQGDRYRIWNLGPSEGFLKKHHKGKNKAFGTKLGLFWDHFWTFSETFSRYFHENAKTREKGKKMRRCRDISHFKIISNVSTTSYYLALSYLLTVGMRGPDSFKYMHIRVFHENMFFNQKTHNASAWGLVWWDPNYKWIFYFDNV